MGDHHTLPQELPVATMHHDGGRQRGGQRIGQPTKSVEEAAAHGGAGLGFDPDQMVGESADEVYLVPRAVPIEVQVAAQAAIVAVLERLDDHEVLEQPTFEGMREDLTLVLDPEQIRRQADIDEEKAWGT